MLGFFRNLSPLELVILATIIILIFGSKAFISMGKTSGESFKEIKNIKKNILEAFESDKPKKKKKEVST